MVYDLIGLLVIIVVSIGAGLAAKRRYFDNLDWHESFGLFLVFFVLLGALKVLLTGTGSLGKGLIGLISISGALFLLSFVVKLYQRIRSNPQKSATS